MNVLQIAELIGGYLAGSLAVMTDAAHLFSDFVGFAVSLLSMWISKRPATHRMTFGYYRAEVLGALLRYAYNFNFIKLTMFKHQS